MLLCLIGSITAAAAQNIVSIQNGKLTLDSHSWTPHGIVQIAFVGPPAAQKGVFAEAYQNYSSSDYQEMRRRGIDSVRIQVSQPGLDPKDPLFDSAFRSQVIEAVHAARAAGLAVMLSVQDEVQSGETHGVAPLPNDATNRVWQSLSPVFANDLGVMY